MNAEDLIAGMALPPHARVDQRVPKKHLLDHAAVNGSDKKAITEGIEEVLWVAALKPHTVGVPVYEDDERKYLEIAVLTLALRAGAKAARLRELVHRAIPYPLVLLTTAADDLVVSMCEIRHAQNEAGKTVLDGPVQFAAVPDGAVGKSFQESISVSGLPNGNLRLLYLGWVERLTALEAGLLLGRWPSQSEPSSRRESVQSIRRLDAEMVELRRLAEAETQLARRVELNLELKRLSAERNRLTALLG